jgi:uncharacterized protein YxjI
MKFPLDLRFKIVAIAQQIAVRDSLGQLIAYVKQKAFKLKEDVTVFADEGQTQPLYRLRADRVLDISAQYRIEDASGRSLGTVKRRGMRSLWRAQYEVSRAAQAGQTAFVIQEANPWSKVGDNVLGEIPILGLLSGYLFHPRYRVTRADTGSIVIEAAKQAAFFEGRFRVDAHEPMSADDELLVVLSVLMMLLLERRRG